MTVHSEQHGPVTVITLSRPKARNAVDGPTAQALAQALRDFDNDASRTVAILTGAGGTFCAGADLKAVAGGDPAGANSLTADGDGPMGPTRLRLSKPIIAAVEGHAVAGGLELACWCDLRVAADNATFGVFCRRFGVPLIDGGTVRLPRLIGQSHAMDMILTGRPVLTPEAQRMGLVNRVCAPGKALSTALELADQLAGFPQRCLRQDRLSVLEQWSLPESDALANEFRRGMTVVESGETRSGAQAFESGQGRGGRFQE